MTTATITSKGQVTIPTNVRTHLGIDTGDRVEFVEIQDRRLAGKEQGYRSNGFPAGRRSCINRTHITAVP
jgi:AbrB family looped-hinge helix DNA binding protein